MFYEYSDTETEYLKRKDKRLGEAIDRIGHIQRGVDGDLFSSVIHSIIAQQISSAALKTVWSRLADKLGDVTFETVSATPREDLQNCGITFKKADYIKDFAEKVKCGGFDIDALRAMPDKELIIKMSSLKGIGVWTAEMLMIFCLQRPDVVSYGDLAIQRGMRMLYNHKKIDRDLFDKYVRRYSPHGSVASLYLWAISSGAIPEMRDPASGGGNT